MRHRDRACRDRLAGHASIICCLPAFWHSCAAFPGLSLLSLTLVTTSDRQTLAAMDSNGFNCARDHFSRAKALSVCFCLCAAGPAPRLLFCRSACANSSSSKQEKKKERKERTEQTCCWGCWWSTLGSTHSLKCIDVLTSLLVCCCWSPLTVWPLLSLFSSFLSGPIETPQQ